MGWTVYSVHAICSELTLIMDTFQIEIRLATIKDTNLLSVLATTTFYEAYFEQDDPADLAEYIIDSFSPSAIAEELREHGSFFLIISLDGRAVGFARLISGTPDPSVNTEKTIELKRFYIVERVWGKGIGEMLRCVAGFTLERDDRREVAMDLIMLDFKRLRDRDLCTMMIIVLSLNGVNEK